MEHVAGRRMSCDASRHRRMRQLWPENPPRWTGLGPTCGPSLPAVPASLLGNACSCLPTCHRNKTLITTPVNVIAYISEVRHYRMLVVTPDSLLVTCRNSPRRGL